MIIYVRTNKKELKYKGYDPKALKRMAANFAFGKSLNVHLEDGVLVTRQGTQPSRIATITFSDYTVTLYSQDMTADADAVTKLTQSL